MSRRQFISVWHGAVHLKSGEKTPCPTSNQQSSILSSLLFLNWIFSSLIWIPLFFSWVNGVWNWQNKNSQAVNESKVHPLNEWRFVYCHHRSWLSDAWSRETKALGELRDQEENSPLPRPSPPTPTLRWSQYTFLSRKDILLLNFERLSRDFPGAWIMPLTHFTSPD